MEIGDSFSGRSCCSAACVVSFAVCNHNISPISPIKALSQVSSSVVEVWQPEEADPLVPLQVIFPFHYCFCAQAIRLWPMQ